MRYLNFTLIVFLSVHFAGKSQSIVKETGKVNSGYISKWIASARNKVEVLPKDNVNASVTGSDGPVFLNHTSAITSDADSALRELMSGYGGILINHGWLRILASGCKRLNRSLPEWNKGKSFTNDGDNLSYLLIADDAVGGFFALNMGGIDNENINRVFYYGPNGLNWQSTGLDYRRFMSLCFTGNISDFYSDFFWKGWQDEVSKLGCDEAVSCYPLLWTNTGKEMKCNRKVVSTQKIWDQYHHNDVAVVKKRNSRKSEKGHQKGDSHNSSSSLVYQKH
jgi:hypothetical protein